MSIRSIIAEAMQTQILTTDQEEAILLLIKSGMFNEEDALAIDELMAALSHGQIRRVV